MINDPAVEVLPATARGAPAGRAVAHRYRDVPRAGKGGPTGMFNAPTLPGMLTGATDNAQLRAKGVQAYGVGPIVGCRTGPARWRALR